MIMDPIFLPGFGSLQKDEGFALLSLLEQFGNGLSLMFVCRIELQVFHFNLFVYYFPTILVTNSFFSKNKNVKFEWERNSPVTLTRCLSILSRCTLSWRMFWLRVEEEGAG